MTRRTLRDAAAQADASRFVGRDDERRLVADLLDDDTPSRILYVHGPGGIGKSTLLRFTGRQASAAGFSVRQFDPRSGSHRFDAVVGTLAEPEPEPDAEPDPERGPGSADDERICVIVDEADRLGSELTVLRDRLLDTLADSSRIVFAGRQAPNESWRLDGLDAVVVDVALTPMSDGDARALLGTRGVVGKRADELVGWAQGSPLALTLAAMAPDGRHGASSEQTLEARLTSWIAGVPHLDVATDFLEVAALAPMVDARLLAAALPARSTRDAMSKLTRLPVVEAIGDRAVLHPVLAAAISSRLAKLEPERHRAVRRRIVEHLGARARLGDIGALIEMSQFISDPDLRRAISNHPSGSLFTDVPSDGELDGFAVAHGFDQGTDWPEVAAWMGGPARYRLVVRRTDGSIVLFCAFTRADASPSSGPVTQSLLGAVAKAGADPARSFVGVVLFADAPAELTADAARLGSGALMHLHGMPDMQALFLHFPDPDRRPIEALVALASPLHAELARPVAISDYRPDGVVGFVESVVLGELGFRSRAGGHEALLAADDDPERQARLRARLDEVFGDSEVEQRLRTVIELVHFAPRRKEAECLQMLNVSRRTWFRLLRHARERVLDPEG